jgi:hypothetical protein
MDAYKEGRGLGEGEVHCSAPPHLINIFSISISSRPIMPPAMVNDAFFPKSNSTGE